MVIQLENKLKEFDRNNVILSDLFEKNAHLYPSKPCVIYNNQVWTFADVSYFLHYYILMKKI